jgi:hypothetical protein
MLLQLENTSYANVKKLLEYARELNLNLRLIDQGADNITLQGKPLSEADLRSMIETSRKTGEIDMESAHSAIRKTNL